MFPCILPFPVAAGLCRVGLPGVDPDQAIAHIDHHDHHSGGEGVTDQPVSSKDAKAGQPVSATVAKDVTIGGKVLIPKGATAKLSVSSVQASGRLSTPAK